MRTHVIKDRYGLFSTVEIYYGDTRVAITTCRPGNERRTAERLKALHKHRKPPADDPTDDPIDDPRRSHRRSHRRHDANKTALLQTR